MAAFVSVVTSIWDLRHVLSAWIEHHSGLASWVQGAGSVGAIVYAYQAGRQQTKRDEEKDARLAQRRRNSFIAIANVGKLRAESVLKLVKVPRLNQLFLFSIAMNREVAAAADAIGAIPLHEIGSADAVLALSSMRSELILLQDQFLRSCKEIATTPAERMYPNNPSESNVARAEALELITAHVEHIRKQCKDFIGALEAADL